MKIESKVVVSKIDNRDVYEVGRVGDVLIYSNISANDSDSQIIFYYVRNSKVLASMKVNADSCQNFAIADYEFQEVE